MLSGYAPADGEQQALRERFLRHLRQHPDGMLRDGPPVHLTVGMLLLDAAGERVLLTLHGKAKRWLQLGGHVEPQDEGLRAAAIREAREEGGIAQIEVSPEPVSLHAHTLGDGFGRCTEHLDVRFAGRASVGAEPVRSDESDDLAWWPVADLPDDLEPDLVATIRSLAAS